MCAIELPLTNGRVERAVIFNVYAPSSDADLKFNESIHDLKRLVEWTTTLLPLSLPRI